MSVPPGVPNPQQIAQMWEAGARSLTEGWRQAQEFWNNAARGWSELASAWMSQSGPFPGAGPAMSSEASAAWRELQEASFAVGQAWMRLPLVMAAGGQPAAMQEAITTLTLAQGRAYKAWLEALKAASTPRRP
jgi:hypothetical protein